MYGDDGPDDDDSEHFIDAGWWTPDHIEELRDIIAKVDLTKPTPGDRAIAALILLNSKINPQPEIERIGEDPFMTWARVLLDHDQ